MVASFTDAWIETKYPDVNRKDKGVASFTDAWIETKLMGVFQRNSQSHLLQMRGLKHERRGEYWHSH